MPSLAAFPDTLAYTVSAVKYVLRYPLEIKFLRDRIEDKPTKGIVLA